MTDHPQNSRKDHRDTGADFSAIPSPPRAPRALRLMVYLLLLALALASIWFIDRGAMLTNSHPMAATRPAH